MENRILKVTAEILITADNFEKHHIPYILSAVEDLKSAETSVKFNEIFLKNVKCNINFKKASKKIAAKFSDIGKLEISSEIEIKASHYKPSRYRTEKEFWDYMQAELGYEYFLEIKRLMILGHIAFPGALKPYWPVIITHYKNSKKKTYKSYRIFSLHREILDEVHELNWPKFKKIPFKKVLKWFFENDMTFKKISSSRLSRVINAYSQLFVERVDDNFYLIWALLSLEAIYCTKNNASNWQITNKSQKVLGNIVLEKLNQLQDMYRFRSKFIHGEIDIPPVDFDPQDTFPFEERMYKATALSIAILTATLQQMVLQDIRELPLRD